MREKDEKIKRPNFLADPAVKAHVRRLLSPGQPTNEEESTTESSKENPLPASKDDKELADVSSTGSPTPMTMTAATRSNGSCSDASVSSELEALLPAAVDHFKEEERSQWEPLGTSGEKFARQKNTPRYKSNVGIREELEEDLKENESLIRVKVFKK